MDERVREELDKLLEEFWFDNCDTDASGYDLPNAYKVFRMSKQGLIDKLFRPDKSPVILSGIILGYRYNISRFADKVDGHTLYQVRNDNLFGRVFSEDHVEDIRLERDWSK